jgi:Lon protease-like protein
MLPNIFTRYKTLNDLPEIIPVLPLRKIILLPRATLPLNIFEERYIEMLDDALSERRLIGLIQPRSYDGRGESPADKDHPLKETGCVGRITSFSEMEDGRMIINLTGICRFNIVKNIETDKQYRTCMVVYDEFEQDLVVGAGENDVDRERMFEVLRKYLEANNMEADWDNITSSSSEVIINTLSMLSPYAGEEKQALLEASSLRERAEILMALAEIELASAGNGAVLQ